MPAHPSQSASMSTSTSTNSVPVRRRRARNKRKKGAEPMVVPPPRRRHLVDPVFDELTLIRGGQLDTSTAAILTSDEKLAIAKHFFVTCPWTCKNRRGEVTFYARRRVLEQHFRKGCQGRVPEKDVKELAARCMPEGDWEGGCAALVWKLKRCP